MVTKPRALPAYRAVAAMLAFAVTMNLWTGNALWLVYTLTGCVAYLAFLTLVFRRGWNVPERVVWLGGLAASMHYVGGSLSGVHRIGGPNGVYFVLPWWDNAVHFLGAAGVAVAAHAVLIRLADAAALRAFLAVCVATFLGVIVELYEFAGFVWFGTVDQGYYTNTLLDLYYNLLGAAAGIAASTMLARRSPTPMPA